MDEEEICNKVEVAFGEERAEWTAKFNDFAERGGSAEKLASVQVDILSHRQMCCEKVSKYRNSLSSRNSKDAIKRRERLHYYKTSHSVKLTDREIKETIEADMAMRVRGNEMIETQIMFFTEAVRTLDKMGYGVTNRLEMLKLNL